MPLRTITLPQCIFQILHAIAAVISLWGESFNLINQLILIDLIKICMIFINLDFRCSDADDVLGIIGNRVGPTLTKLSLVVSNAMNNWQALAFHRKITEVTLYNVTYVDEELLTQLCPLPSMKVLFLFIANSRYKLRFTETKLAVIEKSRVDHMDQLQHCAYLELVLMNFLWRNQEEVNCFSKRLLRSKVVLVPTRSDCRSIFTSV